MDTNIGLKRKAQLMLTEGRLEEALHDWEQILNTSEPDPYDYVTVGDLLLRLGRFDEARQHYEKASHSYESLGFLRNAIGVTQKLLRTGEDVQSVRLRLARLYMADGLLAEATEQAVAFVEALSPEAEPPDEAIILLEDLKEKGLLQPELALRLADFYEALGRSKDAARELLSLAEVLPKQGEDQKSISLRERARRLDPHSVVSMDPQEGEEEGGEVQVRVPVLEPSAEIRTHVTEVITRGEWVEAVSYLEALLSQNGKTGRFLEKLVEAHGGLGDNALTVASLERLALHFEESGRLGKAMECWNRILALDPRHSAALVRTVAEVSDDQTPQIVVTECKETSPGTPRLDVEELLRDFQDEVSRQIPSEDGESHYALALSHYEMGFYDKSLEALEIVLGASNLGSDLELRCRELQERCHTKLARSSRSKGRSNEDSASDAA